MDNEPELKQHLGELIKAYPKGAPAIIEFKKLIGECNGGQFNTKDLLAIKKRIKLKEWGKTAELSSWQQVLDRHGQNVAYAALRQGTLPYVPHSMLKPGHGLKWPESHEFVLTKR